MPVPHIRRDPAHDVPTRAGANKARHGFAGRTLGYAKIGFFARLAK